MVAARRSSRTSRSGTGTIASTGGTDRNLAVGVMPAKAVRALWPMTDQCVSEPTLIGSVKPWRGADPSGPARVVPRASNKDAPKWVTHRPLPSFPAHARRRCPTIRGLVNGGNVRPQPQANRVTAV